jgi:cytidylate kinase
MAINVAIDGTSASGKSTISKLVCKELNYKHLDTGAMYRCAALKAKQSGTDIEDSRQLEAMLADMTIAFTADERVLLDGRDVTDEIRTDEISMLASDISTKPEVRRQLVAQQQQIAKAKGYVMDGRDIGTVVLPDAEVKIYMTASVEARAHRRYLENRAKGIPSNLRQLKKEIIERDYQDTHRQYSPLRKADDAIEIDTSDMTIQQVVDKVMNIIEAKLPKE